MRIIFVMEWIGRVEEWDWEAQLLSRRIGTLVVTDVAPSWSAVRDSWLWSEEQGCDEVSPNRLVFMGVCEKSQLELINRGVRSIVPWSSSGEGVYVACQQHFCSVLISNTVYFKTDPFTVFVKMLFLDSYPQSFLYIAKNAYLSASFKFRTSLYINTNHFSSVLFSTFQQQQALSRSNRPKWARKTH